ncbi:hypothetical protein V2J09_018360 [Rumex salicifolius]
MSTISQNNDVLRSPFGRVFSRPETDQVINCALGLRHHIDLAALKAALSASSITQHPRFTSLLIVPNPRRPNHKRWRKTSLNIDDHVIVVDYPRHNSASSDQEAETNAYLAELAVAAPMSKDKPLWEVHVLMSLNCVVLRVHHALGDGISLMSLLVACFGGDKAEAAAAGGGGKKRSGRWRKGGMWGMVKSVYYTAAYEAELMGRILGVVKDTKTVVSGGDGVELWPRAVVTANFNVDDIKEVKKAISNATMNDVLLGVIASGLAKYLDLHSPKCMVKGIEVTSLVLANLRKNSGLQDVPNLMKNGSGSSWGNKFGLFSVPINCNQDPVHPLQHVTRMKSIMDRKKQSFEAHLLHSSLAFALSFLGSKMGSWFYKRVLRATTLLFSNIVGPQEEISIAANPVTFIKLCISSFCQAMTLHLVSYNGRADLQISVAKDIISDVEFLAKCFEDALLEMKNAIKNPMSNIIS